MHIPLCDLKQNYKDIRSEIDFAINDVISNSKFILGERVKQFEFEFSKYNNSNYCIGVSNATDGLTLALMALELNKDDEVILPTFTVTADYEAVIAAGATPVLCDVDSYGNISIDSITEKLNPKTKAIIVVHMFGNPCLIGNINTMAENIGVTVIEDCSHAHGAEYCSSKVGTFGKCGVFSFFPSKVLGSYGDAGAIITDDTALETKIRALRDHGRLHKEKYTHHYIGRNCRMDGLQAAILSVKLKQLDNYIRCRRFIAESYEQYLTDKVKLLSTKDSVNYVYPILYKNRDKLKLELDNIGIKTGIHYPKCIHQQPFYKEVESFPNAEYLADNILSLPMFPEMTADQINYIVDAVEDFT